MNTRSVLRTTSYLAVLSLLTALLLGGCGGSRETGVAESATSSGSQMSKETMAASAPSATQDGKQLLAVGTQAPDFTVKDDQGNPVSLAELKDEENVVLVFYPGDDTPGCTKQLCTIRDDWSAFADKNVAVYGVNPAGAESHQKFIQKYNFPFPLLVDSDKEVAHAYGCEGDSYVQRTVYGIDKNGSIVFAQRGMPSTDEILSAFQ